MVGPLETDEALVATEWGADAACSREVGGSLIGLVSMPAAMSRASMLMKKRLASVSFPVKGLSPEAVSVSRPITCCKLASEWEREREICVQVQRLVWFNVCLMNEANTRNTHTTMNSRGMQTTRVGQSKLCG